MLLGRASYQKSSTSMVISFIESFNKPKSLYCSFKFMEPVIELKFCNKPIISFLRFSDNWLISWEFPSSTIKFRWITNNSIWLSSKNLILMTLNTNHYLSMKILSHFLPILTSLKNRTWISKLKLCSSILTKFWKRLKNYQL